MVYTSSYMPYKDVKLLMKVDRCTRLCRSKSTPASKTLGFGSDQTLIRFSIILLILSLNIHICYRYT